MAEIFDKQLTRVRAMQNGARVSCSGPGMSLGPMDRNTIRAVMKQRDRMMAALETLRPYARGNERQFFAPLAVSAAIREALGPEEPE